MHGIIELCDNLESVTWNYQYINIIHMWFHHYANTSLHSMFLLTVPETAFDIYKANIYDCNGLKIS